ncbi:hypothetical protein LTR84_004432 [Exophiala bonariae]|uniref:Uncharacterized protein n=1 Tax=Exophiala bonariae TaxID=1690606 RepID=A0AAV9N4U4_9EURO|nr:hypothetical protein LTR84_004432 [Exophiala bonariae]
MSSSNTSRRSGTHELHRYLYDDSNLVDRLHQGSRTHALRLGATTPRQVAPDGKANHSQSSPAASRQKRRDTAAVRQLERDMDARTDAQMLRTARQDQANRDLWPK